MQMLLKPLLFVRTKTGYSIFTIVVVALFSVWVFYEATKAEVVVAEDGDVQVVKTHVDTVGELMDDLGINIGENDKLSHKVNTKVVDGMKIDLNIARDVVVVIDGEIEEYITTAQTVGEFFEEKNIQLSRYDDVSHSNMHTIDQNLQIDIVRAYAVEVKHGADTLTLWTTGGTVEEILSDNEITYTDLDKIEPTLKSKITEETSITIIQVEKELEEVEETIAFKTVEQKDANLNKGSKKTLTDGVNGKALKVYEVIFENGEEVAREVVSEDIITKSVDQVIAVGTKVAEKQVAAKNKAAEPAVAGVEYTMEATAYSPYCNGCSGISASGMDLRVDPMPRVVAVDPSIIPLGSKVWVEGYGEAIAADTGGSIKGHKLDVLLPKGETMQWGRKNVKVKVLD